MHGRATLTLIPNNQCTARRYGILFRIAKACRKQRVVLEGRIHFRRATGVLTGSCVCMPMVGPLHGRYLYNNTIKSMPSDAFTTLVNLETLYVPPFTLPAAFLCPAGCTKTNPSVSPRLCCSVACHAVRSAACTPSTPFTSLLLTPKHMAHAVHVHGALPRACGRVIT